MHEIFVILDACRNNPLLSSTRNISGGLATVSESSGTLIAYATAPGAVAEDGVNNSPYAHALAELMIEPGIAVESLFRRVRTRVAAATDNRQRPWMESGLSGEADYCFAGCSQLTTQSAAIEVPIISNDLGTALAQAVSADTLEAYQLFEKQFPHEAEQNAYVQARLSDLSVSSLREDAGAKTDPSAQNNATNSETAPSVTERGDRDAKPIQPPIINYPTRALERGITGSCEVAFHVDTSGRPYNIDAICTNNLFRREAMRALSRVEFTPKIINGTAVERRNVVYPLVFSLAD